MLAAFLVIALALSFLSKGLQQSIQRQQSELTSATKQAGNAIANLTILKCHNTQTSPSTYGEILSTVSRRFRAQSRIVAIQTGFMRFVATSLLVLALFFGDHLIHNADASPGTVLAAFWCCVTPSKGFNEILTQILVLEKGRAAAEALCGLLQQVDRGNKLSDDFRSQTLSNLEGDIELRQVRPCGRARLLKLRFLGCIRISRSARSENTQKCYLPFPCARNHVSAVIFLDRSKYSRLQICCWRKWLRQKYPECTAAQVPRSFQRQSND